MLVLQQQLRDEQLQPHCFIFQMADPCEQIWMSAIARHFVSPLQR
jgi:hypothetical protein